MQHISEVIESLDVSRNPANEKYWNCWKLTTNHGRQVWQFIPPAKSSPGFLKKMGKAFEFKKQSNPNAGDKVYRSQALHDHDKPFNPAAINIPGNLTDPVAKEAFLAACRGANFYQHLQAEEGHWPGDYGGPMFLLPGLIMAAYITCTPFPEPHIELMKQYMLNHQNEDGGWGLHIEGKSTMFGTVMQYVALRILGEQVDQPRMIRALKWIQQNGGATGIPPWGKFYLATLGVYEWEGCNSLLPEMWLLPKSIPIHPWRYWCHSRMVYLPMAYCYGHRVTGKITPLVRDLRIALYNEEYGAINWQKARDQITGTDVYAPASDFLTRLNRLVINPYERFHHKALRKKALDFILEYINAEDAQTNYVNIGPVNQVINSLCVWHAYGKDSTAFKKHVDRWQDYLWVAEDGMKMNGYNGSQLWDTTFAMQAIMEGGLEQFYPDMAKKAYHYVDITQVREEVPQREIFFRHISKGGWPFSTLDHGWPITDCTAEGLSAVLKAHHSVVFKEDKPLKKISDDRLFDAVNIILSFQNSDGGWATYENTRSRSWIELLNPSGIFKDIMIDYSYTECTSACIRALSEFRHDYPAHRSGEIDRAIRNGVAFIKAGQRPDGAWLGSWAVCFTYGTWFAVEGLVAGKEGAYQSAQVSPSIKKACEFLLSKQNADGGWGESYTSCVAQQYIPHEKSQVVNTSWALLALMAAKYPDNAPLERGIKFLMKRQQKNGDWEQGGISGVFNANCMITYTAYRNIFPLWALGRYKVLNSL